jgi:hypothetical protein
MGSVDLDNQAVLKGGYADKKILLPDLVGC